MLSTTPPDPGKSRTQWTQSTLEMIKAKAKRSRQQEGWTTLSSTPPPKHPQGSRTSLKSAGACRLICRRQQTNKLHMNRKTMRLELLRNSTLSTRPPAIRSPGIKDTGAKREARTRGRPHRLQAVWAIKNKKLRIRTLMELPSRLSR